MQEHEKQLDALEIALRERAKELNCLYAIEELFSRPGITLPQIMDGVAGAIPPGWQFPEICEARVRYGELAFATRGFRETPWVMTADLRVEETVVGHVDVCYTAERPASDEGPFLKEERRLIDTVAELLGQLLLQRDLASSLRRSEKSGLSLPPDAGDWWVIVDFLRQIDRPGYVTIARRMLNYLCMSGVEEVGETLLPGHTSHEDDRRSCRVDAVPLEDVGPAIGLVLVGVDHVEDHLDALGRDRRGGAA